MEAKNLRIGNYVKHNHSIGMALPTQLTSGNDFDMCDDFEPLPLNNEWLSKFGFDDSGYQKGYTGVEFRVNMIMDFILTKPKFMGEWQEHYCYDLGQHRFVEVKYVHELQNLFFAITTTELQIKQDVSACG